MSHTLAFDTKHNFIPQNTAKEEVRKVYPIAICVYTTRKMYTIYSDSTKEKALGTHLRNATGAWRDAAKNVNPGWGRGESLK